jgi:type VI secretion system FHA domain protein
VTPPPASATLPKERPARAFIPENYDPLAPDTFSGLEPVAPAPPGEREAPAAPPTPPPLVAPPPAMTGREPAMHARVPPGGGADRPVSPVVPPRADPSGHGDLAAVLAAAGLEGVPVTPELAAKFGEILRIVVIGVMDVLRSRNQVKDEFRMRMTHFRPVDNNPLKFSANVDDALHNLLVKRNEAYLGPVEAFQDAFDDLRNHQLAMLAGMRVAFEFTLSQFDPDRLQAQFDQQAKKGSVFAVGTKLRYWDLFRERRQEIARDPEASFRDFFGEAFAEAYEVQMKRLKDEHRRT